MTTPLTELDSRFSEPDAQPVSWEQTLAEIKRAELFWISTVRADGRPHVTPLVAVWLDDALHFSTGPHEQKALNLAANPRVALTTGANDWQSGLDVVIEGEAIRVISVDKLHQLAHAWAQKWDGRWDYEVGTDGFGHGPGTAFVFAVRPSKVLAFAKGQFSHTRHRF
jgi:general stress protein 26